MSYKPNLSEITNQAYSPQAIAVEQNTFLKANIITYKAVVGCLDYIGTKVSTFYENSLDTLKDIGSNIMYHGSRRDNKGSKNKNKYDNGKRTKVKGKVKPKIKK